LTIAYDDNRDKTAQKVTKLKLPTTKAITVQTIMAKNVVHDKSRSSGIGKQELSKFFNHRCET
jgi:hypothetical protein